MATLTTCADGLMSAWKLWLNTDGKLQHLGRLLNRCILSFLVVANATAKTNPNAGNLAESLVKAMRTLRYGDVMPAGPLGRCIALIQTSAMA